MILLILHCYTMYYHRKDLPSTSTTSGNASELNSITRNGLFQEEYGRNSMRSDKTKDRARTRKLGSAFKIIYFGLNLKLRPKERSGNFYPTRSHAVVLCNTLPAACIEKAVRMKTQDELYQKVRLTQRMPRVVLKIEFAIWSTRSTKPKTQRSSWKPSSDSRYKGNL